MTPMNSPSSCNPQRGFTLLEILVALTIIALISATVLPALQGIIRFSKKEQTHARLVAAATALKVAYQNNAMSIDSQSGAQFCINAGCSESLVSPGNRTTYPSATPAATAVGAAGVAALNAIGQAQGLSVGHLAVDGFQKYFKFFVSNRLKAASAGPGGYPIYYHVIAVVSSGGRGSLSTGTVFNTATGQLTLGAGDQGTVISGLTIERDLLQQTLQAMQQVATAYGQVFTSAFLASANRDTSVDYFSASDCPDDCTGSGLFDSASTINNSGGNHGGWAYSGTPYPGDPASPLTDAAAVLKDCQPATVLTGFQGTLGVSTPALQSAWGYPLAVCNGPNADAQITAVRNPASSNTALQTPPYTAAIEAWAPGEVPLAVSVTGEY